MNASVKLPPEPTTGFPRATWRTTAASARSLAIKRRLLETPRQIDVERARYTTQSYQASEGQPMVMRRAKMLLHLVRAMSITIDEGELIAGNRSLLPRMGVIAPEGAVTWVDRELDILSTRPQDRFNITAEQVHELREEVFPYWRGKTLEDIVATRVPPDIMKAVRGKAFSLNQTDHAQGHILPDVETWLQLGITGLRAKVQEARRQPAMQASDRQIFYAAAEIALTAAQTLFERYADLAAEMAQRESDPRRAAELTQIAANCRHLATDAPETYYQALQAVWFLFVLVQIESNASSFSPGRFDQYMLPYLLTDLHTGRLAQEQAQELLEALWLKFNEIVLLRSSSSAALLCRLPHRFQYCHRGTIERRQRRHRSAHLYVSARPGRHRVDTAQPVGTRACRQSAGTAGDRSLCHFQGQWDAADL